MADDSFGSSADKGFRGHLSALFHGRLTTGALKLFGIGLLAAFSMAPDFGSLEVPAWVVTAEWVLQVLAIALTANLLNLIDLRPGRALKVYSLLAIVGVRRSSACRRDGPIVPFDRADLLGPVFAIWGFDLRERGMLGDAGRQRRGRHGRLGAGQRAGRMVVGAGGLRGRSHSR